MNSEMPKNINVGFVGGGNMAQAIGMGLMNKGVLAPEKVWVSSRTSQTLNIWKNFGKVNTTLNNYEIIKNCDIIFIAVKPQYLDAALQTCKDPEGHQYDNKLFISVIVGLPLDVLNKKLEVIAKNPRIVRSMPNTPMLVSEGITVYCCLNTSDADKAMTNLMFSQLGLSEEVPESLMNSIGGLSGSGPAYAYLIIESLADGGVMKGIPRDLAMKFAAQVLVGAGKMVLETSKHPGKLKDDVTSPGGSTIAGIHAMESGSVRASMINAVNAAVNRSNELTLLSSKK